MKNNLRIKETSSGELALSGVTEVYVTDEVGIFGAMQRGKANRATAPTLMNAESSRSHSLLIMTVAQKDVKTERTLRARLVLGDLAGSERVKKTGVSGIRLDEAKKINRSLTTLGMVINSLTDGSTHVPYRDSKLTRVLQDSLGGNSRTALIVCCAPERSHALETVSTLRFGERASRICNVVVRNEELSVKELQILLDAANEEIERLRSAIAKLESEWPQVIAVKNGFPSNRSVRIFDTHRHRHCRRPFLCDHPEGKSGPNDGDDSKSCGEKLMEVASNDANVFSAIATIDDVQFTKDLLTEINSIGLDGDEMLSPSMLGVVSIEDRAETLAKQVTILKTQLKKQRLLHIHSFKRQTSMENEIAELRAQATVATYDKDIASIDEGDDASVATIEDGSCTLFEMRERLQELESVNTQLALEKEEHDQTRAEALALQEALNSMAKEHLLDKETADHCDDDEGRESTTDKGASGAPSDTPPCSNNDGDDNDNDDEGSPHDLHNVLSGPNGAAVVSSPLAKKAVNASPDEVSPLMTPPAPPGTTVASMQTVAAEDQRVDIERLGNLEKEVRAMKDEKKRLLEDAEHAESEQKILERENLRLIKTIETMEIGGSSDREEVEELKKALREMEEGGGKKIEELTQLHDIRVTALTEDANNARAELLALQKQQHQKQATAENLVAQLPPGQLSNLKSLSSELQSMIDDEIEELEQELQEAESNAAKANKDLQAVREELVLTKSKAFETERELRKELLASRKQIEYLNDREVRAAESVEKRRSSRGNFWSRRRLLSEASSASGDTSSDMGRIKSADVNAERTVESLEEDIYALEEQYHSNLDAHALVLETKEEVLRSLLKQNASLTLGRSSLQRENEGLQRQIESLMEALTAIQKAQAAVVGGGAW